MGKARPLYYRKKRKANHASIPAELYPQCKVTRNNKMLGVYEPIFFGVYCPTTEDGDDRFCSGAVRTKTKAWQGRGVKWTSAVCNSGCRFRSTFTVIHPSASP